MSVGDDFTCIVQRKLINKNTRFSNHVEYLTKCFGINIKNQLEIPDNRLESREILDISSGGEHTCLITKVFNGSQLNHMSTGKRK